MHYHRCCRRNYQNRADVVSREREKMKKNNTTTDPKQEIPSSSCVESTWHRDREVHNQAFQVLKEYISDTIFKQKEVHLLSDINAYYESILKDIGGGFVKSSSHKF